MESSGLIPFFHFIADSRLVIVSHYIIPRKQPGAMYSTESHQLQGVHLFPAAFTHIQSALPVNLKSMPFEKDFSDLYKKMPETLFGNHEIFRFQLFRSVLFEKSLKTEKC